MEDMVYVELLDENGSKVRFERLLTFEFDDGVYVAVTPQTQFEDIENGEVMLLEIREDENGMDCYLPLESESQLEAVFEQFEHLYYE